MVLKVSSNPIFPAQVSAETPIVVTKTGGVYTFSLDEDAAQSILGAMVVKGSWNATTNTPTLASGVGTTGFAYFVSVAGSTSIDGVSAWSIGDIITFDGTIWRKISASGATLIPAANITDGTAAGRAVLTAADAAAQRTALGLTTIAASGAFADLVTRPSPPPSGRLTLTTSVPILTATVTGAIAVYFTPYNGNAVPIWNGTAFEYRSFSELSQALSDATKSPSFAVANSNYDMFVWSDGGTIRCTRGPAWSSDTARGTGAGTTELEFVNGWWVNKVAIANGPAARYGTYVGSIRTNGTATIDFTFGSSAAGGGAAVLNLWNAYNRARIMTQVSDSNAAHSYTTASWRSFDNSTTMRVSALIGLAEDAVALDLISQITATAASNVDLRVGVALNSTTVPNNSAKALVPGNTVAVTVGAKYAALATLGFNYYQALELGGTAGSFGGADLAYMTYDGRF